MQYRKTIAVAGVLTALFWSATALAEAGESDARLKSVTILVEESSAARRIASDGDAEARALHAEAREHLRQAQAMVAAADERGADRSILLATRTMLQAVQLADREGVVDEIKREDFDDRLASVHALLDAHARVGAEKGQQQGVRALQAAVTQNVQRAQDLLERRQATEARALLDDSYVAIKTALEDLRGGETLVRTLTFASKKEEYRYELDRNDAHRILVKVLLQEEMRDASVRRMVERHMGEAAELRQQGERHAEREEHAEAIALLEAATGEVVKAIRSAGVYVPG